jgi:hypothetical protein
MLNELARAALDRRSLELRELVLELFSTYPDLETISPSSFESSRHRIVAAALLELLAERRGQQSPQWLQTTDQLPEPFFLLESAQKMPRLRQLCQLESPAALKKYGLLAPPHFLEFA